MRHNIKIKTNYSRLKFLTNTGIFLTTIISGVYLTYLRYDNQGSKLNQFNLSKTGNLLSVIFLSLIIILLIVNLFTANKPRLSADVIILVVSVIGLIALFLSGKTVERDNKISYAFIFILCNFFILTSLISVTFSRSKKFLAFGNIIKTILFLIAAFTIIFFQIYMHTDDSRLYENTGRKADAGVILGAAVWGGNRPSPVLRERINKGFEIYKYKYVQKLVLTGGGSPNEMTEADVSKKALVDYGVEVKNIYLEGKSSSTFEQVLYVRDSLYRKLNWSRVILISDNYHLYRSEQICSFNGINADCIASDTPLSTEGDITYCIKETFAVFIYWISGLG